MKPYSLVASLGAATLLTACASPNDPIGVLTAPLTQAAQTLGAGYIPANAKVTCYEVGFSKDGPIYEDGCPVTKSSANLKPVEGATVALNPLTTPLHALLKQQSSF